MGFFIRNNVKQTEERKARFKLSFLQQTIFFSRSAFVMDTERSALQDMMTVDQHDCVPYELIRFKVVYNGNKSTSLEFEPTAYKTHSAVVYGGGLMYDVPVRITLI